MVTHQEKEENLSEESQIICDTEEKQNDSDNNDRVQMSDNLDASEKINED